MNRLLIFMMLFLWPLAGPAMLPPDAQYREKEIFSYRQRKMAEYEQDRKLHEVKMIETDRRVRSEMKLPPWRRAGIQTAMLTRVDSTASAAAEKAQKRNHRLTASIMLLILIGASAGWVRYATREIDSQY